MNLFQKHKIFFLTVILLLPSLLYSQNSKVLNDSIIEKEIKNSGKYLSTNPDSALIIAKKAYSDALILKSKKVESHALYQLGIIYKTLRKFDKAIYFHVESLKIKRKLNDKIEIARSLNALGNTFYEMGNYSKSLTFFKHSFRLKHLIKDEKGAAITLFNIGNVYLDQSQFDTALINFNKALSVFDNLNFEQGKASCFNSIGIIYESLEDYEKALSYYQKSLDIETKDDNYVGMINAYNNIGNIYSIGGMQQNSLNFYKNALNYSEQINDTENIANALKNIGLIYTFRNEFINANNHFIRAKKLSSQIKSKELEINVFHAIGYSYTFQGKCDSAVYYLKKSLENAIKINYNNVIADDYIMLAHANMCAGNQNEAFDYYQKYNHENDKLINELNKTKLQLTNVKEYSRINLEQNLAQILKLKMKSDREYFILIFVIIMFTAIVVFLFYRKKNLNLKYKNLELQQKFLQAQMNPHFIHNTLASIEGHLYKNKPEETSIYISEFSHLIRNILESSRKNFISLQTELKMLQQYVNLQKLRYGELFTCQFNVDASINQESVCIPPMLVQPIIENCIEHAFSGVNYKGEIIVKVQKNNNVLCIEICDNGTGISQLDETKSKKSDCMQLSHKIIAERLASMSNRKTKYKIAINNYCLPPNNTGTKIKINLPFKLLNQIKKNEQQTINIF